MIQVILTILKILGIIILSLLGIIIALLLLVLFVPIRYNIKGTVDSDYNIKAKVTWLLSIVYIGINMNKEGGMNKTIRIFGIPLKGGKGGKKAKKTKKDKKGKKVSVDNTEEQPQVQIESADALTDDSTNVNSVVSDTTVETKEDILTDKEEATADESDDTVDTKKAKKKKAKKDKKEKKSLKTKLKEFKDKCIKIKQKLQKLCSDAKYWIEFINEESTKRCLTMLLGQIKDLLLKIIPKKHKIYLKYGSGDPASTGKITGYAAVAQTMFNLNLTFEPDFDNKVIESKFYFKGHLRIISLLIIAIKIYKNKDFRVVLNTLTK